MIEPSAEIFAQVWKAFERHINEHHNADFEVCDDPGCLAVHDNDVLVQAWEEGVSPSEILQRRQA